MAQFIGRVQGSRGPATRLGSAGSGLTVDADGWNGGITTRIWHDKETGQDRYRVTLTRGSGYEGNGRVLSEGVLDARLP